LVRWPNSHEFGYLQQLRPDSFVLTMGYGESAAGYIAPDRAWDKNDGNLALWCWNAPRTGE